MRPHCITTEAVAQIFLKVLHPVAEGNKQEWVDMAKVAVTFLSKMQKFLKKALKKGCRSAAEAGVQAPC